MNPLVSILIPAHNAEEWIGQTLESVLAQTWIPKEIIVVDDASQDRTLSIAKGYESAILKVIHSKENLGASATRNLCFVESQGSFIQFLDADDLISPNKIADQALILTEFPEHVISSEWARFYKSPKEALFVPEVVWRDLCSVDWLAEAWIAGPMMQPGIWLTHRDVIAKAGPWNEQLSLIDDFEYFTRVLLSSEGVKFCKSARVYYRSGHGQTLSGSNSFKAWQSAFLSLKLGAEYLIKKEDSQRTRRASAIVFQRFIYEVYPDAPELIENAQAKVRDYGGSEIKPTGGPLFALAASIMGWKAARKLQKLVNRFGYKKAAIGWRFERYIKKLNYNHVAHQNSITRGSDRSQ